MASIYTCVYSRSFQSFTFPRELNFMYIYSSVHGWWIIEPNLLKNKITIVSLSSLHTLVVTADIKIKHKYSETSGSDIHWCIFLNGTFVFSLCVLV